MDGPEITAREERPAAEQAAVREQLARAKAPPRPSPRRGAALKRRLARLLEARRARLVAHYYTGPELQDLAQETGGFVGDSLEMARFGRDCGAETLLVAGVRFMGETAKILSPGKTVLMPELAATCSLDIACPPDAFADWCDRHPDRAVVVYANTSAAVKARADWVVTSSIALEVAEHLKDRGEKILWAPDRHLGAYIRRATGADMLLWDAACVVHEEFKARGLEQARALHPGAAVLAHPESPAAVLEMADLVGSTTQILRAAAELPHREIIVATDQGLFHQLRRAAPDKEFIVAPTAGRDATCRSCARCPWMAMNSLSAAVAALRDGTGEILVDAGTAARAMRPLRRMLDFAAERGLAVKGRA